MRLLLTVAALLALPNLASAQQIAPPGAEACTGCHGALPTAMPSLAQLKRGEIVAAMAAFRSGAREATVMDRIAKGFSEAETEAIADWFAAQERKQ
jgi:sulfide dehydrogenase cytochrome subunit